MSERPKSSDEAIDLHDYFERRATITKLLEDELWLQADKLLQLVPDELTAWKEDWFPDADAMAKWLTESSKYLDSDGGTTSKIKTPEDYGMTDNDDVARKFGLLKKAWAGIIDISITNNRLEYVTVNFRFVKK